MPGGGELRYGEVAEAFGQPGGGTQWVVVNEKGSEGADRRPSKARTSAPPLIATQQIGASDGRGPCSAPRRR
nr:TNT domain-containing protein [Mycobacterium lacus]